MHVDDDWREELRRRLLPRLRQEIELYRRENRPRCCARTKAGTPCKTKAVPGRKRCRWHGGLSTGPRTPEGKAKVARNLPSQRKTT
jgi:hypothetical protein